MTVSNSYTKTLLKTGLFLAVALFVYSLFGRFIHIDDAYIAEPAYWIAQKGYAISEVFRGWEHSEEKFLWYHKIFTLSIALLIKIFGYGIVQVKAISLIYFAGVCGLWWRLTRRYRLSVEATLLFYLLLFTNSYIFEKGFVARPEMALCFWSALTYIFLVRFLEDRKTGDWIWAGLCAAMAIGNHLNGVIIAGAGCLLLLWHKEYRRFFFFGVIATLGFATYFWDVRDAHDLHLLWRQFSQHQDVQQGQFGPTRYFWNLVNEQERFLHSPREISITLLLLSTLIFNHKRLWQRDRNMAIFTYSMVFLLALIAHGKSSKYMTIYTPFLIFLVTVSLFDLAGKARKAAGVALVLYLSFQTFCNWELAFIKEDRLEAYRRFVAQIPPDVMILGPADLSFVVTGHRPFQAFQAYQAMKENGLMNYTAEDLQRQMAKFPIGAIIAHRESVERYGFGPEAWGSFKKTDEIHAPVFMLYMKNQ